MRSLCIRLFLLSIVFTGCKKGWLEPKPNDSYVVPQTLQDLRALLDNSLISQSSTPALGELGATDYHLIDADFPSRTTWHKNSYIWASDVFELTESIPEWNRPYEKIQYTNVVLDVLPTIAITPANEVEWKDIKANALFHRAYAHYDLAQVFCKHYDPTTANTDLGIVLRLTSNFNIRSVRSTVQETYNSILSDLNEAIELIGPSTQYKTRASKVAIYAQLARVYLTMGDFDKALQNSEASLALNNSLVDFNTLDSATATPANFPLKLFNAEVLYHNLMSFLTTLTSSVTRCDSIYKLYQVHDLRRSRFYRITSGRINFCGGYGGNQILFTGLAVDEMYLTRAECYARAGNYLSAMQDLNTLLRKRWRNGIPYVDIVAVDAEDALRKVLLERRKELAFRGIRWTDLRRLNKDPRFAITLRRVVLGQEYLLPPNDIRYVYPIPAEEIQLSGIPQNPR